MARLQPEQVAEFREAFSRFDKDDDGIITTMELESVLRSMGHTPTKTELQRIINAADPHGNGTIPFSDFLTIMVKTMENPEVEDGLNGAFRVLDTDGKGFIAADKIRFVMANLGDNVTDEQVDQMISEARIDGDGNVNYEEFLRLVGD